MLKQGFAFAQSDPAQVQMRQHALSFLYLTHLQNKARPVNSNSNNRNVVQQNVPNHFINNMPGLPMQQFQQQQQQPFPPQQHHQQQHHPQQFPMQHHQNNNNNIMYNNNNNNRIRELPR
jgi:hypothetical protein